MLPRSRVLDKLDALLRSNDYAGAKRLLQYWLEDARVSRDDHGVLLMQNELMGLCRKLGEREQALQYAQDALDQVARMDIADNVGAAFERLHLHDHGNLGHSVLNRLFIFDFRTLHCYSSCDASIKELGRIDSVVITA